MMTFDDLRQAQVLHNETNDCSVKALAVSGNMAYAKAHKLCTQYGRKARRGMFGLQIVRMLKAEFNATLLDSDQLQRLKKAVGVKNLTVNNLPKALKACGYGSRNVYAMTCNHALGIRQGEVIDWTDGRRHRIDHVVLMPDVVVAEKPRKKLRHSYAKRMGLDPKTGQPL